MFSFTTEWLLQNFILLPEAAILARLSSGLRRQEY